MTWVALTCWAVTALLAAILLATRRRLERAAEAEHELRGPMAALSLGVEQVRRGHAGSELADVLDAQLDRTRAGLLDLATALRPRGAPLPCARSPVALERLAREAVAGWHPLAVRRGGGLRLDWRAGSATVAVDRGRFAQALGNLLANAVEHGAGEVEVRGRRVGRSVRIEVSNRTGNHEAALRRRHRSGTDDRRARPGASGRGRGLGIAARAVQQSGGTLEVVARRSGTTAAMELPLEEQ